MEYKTWHSIPYKTSFFDSIDMSTIIRILNEETEGEIKRCKIKNFNNSIKDVIFHDPAVIVRWKDGTKTVVTCQEGDTFDKEKGLALAIIKHQFGDIGYYNTIFDKWLKEGREIKD